MCSVRWGRCSHRIPLNIFSKDGVLAFTVFTGYPCKHGVGLIVRENKNLEISTVVDTDKWQAILLVF